MDFVEGQGILGKIKFVDGTMPSYPRTYLIIFTASDYIEILNISSIRGKERKLAFSTNEKLHLFNPPFLKPSFVKLDSLCRVPKSDWSHLKVLHQGETLDKNELNRIKGLLDSQKYNSVLEPIN